MATPEPASSQGRLYSPKSMQEKKSAGLQFLKFLETNNLKAKIGTTDDLRKVYMEDYKKSCQERLRDDVMDFIGFDSFQGMLFSLKRSRWVSVDKNSVTFHSWDDRPANRPRHRTRKNKSSPTKSSPDKSPGSPHKSKSFASVAVDQHFAFRQNSIVKMSILGSNDDEENLPQGVVKFPQNGHFSCKICKVICTTEHNMRSHIEGKQHRTQKLLYNLKINRPILVADKEGVTITATGCDMEDGSMKFDIFENKPKVIWIQINNDEGNDVVIFKHCEMLRKIRVIQLTDHGKVTDGYKTVEINPGGQYIVKMTVKASMIGCYFTPLAFQFKKVQDEAGFHIVRYLAARCTNPVLESLKPTAPYKRPPRVAVKTFKRDVVEGVPLPKMGSERLKRVIELQQHTIPRGLRRVMNRGLEETPRMSAEDKLDMKEIKAQLEAELTMDNFLDKLCHLLHIEEIQMEVDIRKYDMEDVCMRRCKANPRLLVLKVPGLAENRPSVLRGDHLFVHMQKDTVEYKGYVHEVMLDELKLGFDNRLLKNFLPNMKFGVRFVFNRLPLRLQHRAIQLAEECSLDKLLFPTLETASSWGTMQPSSTKLRLNDRKLEDNHEQYTAVQHIVAGSSRPAPYVVFGPPGTGKTVTIVEAMKQIVQCYPNTHILACAPSNSAADLITERLLEHLSKTQVFRMNAFSRSWASIPQKIRSCCNYDKYEDQFFFPEKDELMKYRVVVCTLVTAGRLASANFPPGHFSHVFIDEAGHAIEPECLIPVAGILECDVKVANGGQLVLAGDPEQLGPILRSPVSLKYGLETSILERYMKQCEVYDKAVNPGPDLKSFNPNLITKLVRNYRSHPAILRIPNELFYNSELEPHADLLLRESLCKWEGLPCMGCPIVFHGVIGQDMREERSPSFFNPEEIVHVMKYVDTLLEEKKGGINIHPKDIGIITPYRKQVQKIQGLVRQKRLTEIKVGSVEEFQGQERKVIIISTVRSNPEYMSMDIEYQLGFVKNPKRFNVSLTRAKALLIVIGNPYVLRQDPCWSTFLNYCRGNGAYKGCDFDNLEDHLEDITQRFNAVSLSQESEDGVEVSQLEQQVEPEWTTTEKI
ncbi:unnamed protein product [Owenia fusiformis]|uniref:RNA helicase n=1 Tax=Owenia fusiformis TaxID=6347 RepID=A0A8J1XEW7_OWEFU|nr:unnamed protein product [Owenia fusiformis]